jgi:type IV pilus assembly protein PilY1
MNRYMKKMRSLVKGFLSAGLLSCGLVHAEVPAQDPLFLISPVKPIMMFNMSKDHQLFFKLYDDYSDIDGDGDIDTTYNNNFEYYGYFDSGKCYTYDSANKRFSPNGVTPTNHYCQLATDTTNYWSGNFLNWATMTRIDAIRKILYGGTRSTDEANLTVLERAFLPNDAHSFAKWYGEPDLRRLTPFDADATNTDLEKRGLTLCNTTEPEDRDTYSQHATGANDLPLIRLAKGNYSLWASNERWQCRWGIENNDNDPDLTKIYAYSESPDADTLDVTTTVSLAGNVTVTKNNATVNYVAASGQDFSGLAANGKITIGGTEYTIKTVTPTQLTLKSKYSGSTGTKSYTASYSTTTATNTELVARVIVCDENTLSEIQQCQSYLPTSGVNAGKNILKPIGLLQEYASKVNFGLMTGSYGKNKSGGVLRKLVGPIDVKDSLNDVNGDEIGDDGIFKVPSGSQNSIIKTLDLLRIFGYNFDDGTYNSTESDGDDCEWGKSAFNDGQCSNWGNPQAEIFLESLRYLAGKDASTDFAVVDSAFITDLNYVADWGDGPITAGTSGNKCAALNVLQFNASTTSYDNNSLGVTADINISFSDAGIRAATSHIGEKEGIKSVADILGNFNKYFVGDNSVVADRDQLCTAKLINSGTGGLGNVEGTCSEAPRLEGGYNIAGLAYLARKNGIGSDREKVKTHGVVLAPAIPSISIPVPGSTTKTITILPACRNLSPEFGDGANCALVDFKVVSQQTLGDGTEVGSLYVNWEDSEQGGDYDQDMWGIINYSVSSTKVEVTTDVLAESTPYKMGFGYVISGTEEDGFHVHSGIEGFTRDESGTVDCASGCEEGDGATTREYIVGVTSAEPLKNPLWYAAKWGGYTKNGLADDEINALDPEVQTFDSVKTTTVVNNQTYFYATNPITLKAALKKLFESIAGSVGSASTVAANSTSAEGETHIYQARFDSEDWSGQVLDFGLEEDLVTKKVVVGTTPAWDTHDTMDRSSGFLTSRNVYTYDGTTPVVVKLTDTNIDLTDATVLDNSVPTLTKSLKLGSETDYSYAVRRIKWLRGDDTDEKVDEESLLFRKRTHLLGDIINSDPGYAGAGSQRHNNLPSATAFGAASYTTYLATKKARRKIVFVGANDGMLHAFDAADGKEIFAYIPRGVYKKLASLTNANYSHQYTVDGPVYVSDYYRKDGTWGTVVAGTLGAGGRGAYALDVTAVLANTTDTSTAPTVIFDISDDDTTTAQPNTTLKNDIGYSGSKVLVLPVNASTIDGGGRWMAFFSNGTDSVNNQAKLIGIDVNDPTKFVSIDTGVAANGLSPAAFLLGGQNVIGAVYAGDILGKMWKFDLSNQDYTAWDVAYMSGTTPLPLINVVDASGNAQPITAEPTLGLNSLKLVSGQPSVMVYFATGKYSVESDLTDNSIQTFYAVADTGSSISINASNRTTLLHEKWITSENSGKRVVLNDKVSALTDTSPAVDWASKNGWFMDLVVKTGDVKAGESLTVGTAGGERGLNKPLLISDRVILNTFTPSPNQCDYGGNGWLMELVGVGDKFVDHSVLNSQANTQLSRPIISDLVPFQAGDNILILGSNLGGKKEDNVGEGDSATITAIEGKAAAGTRGRMSWRQVK